MPQTSHRSSQFTESVIRTMTRIANSCNAVNLSQGFPDFDPPAELLKALKNCAEKGPHQYSITWGANNFRAALAAKVSRFMNVPIHPDEHIVVTCGSTEAMMATMLAVCNPGDRVIVFSPFYENYTADTILSGAVPIFVPLYFPDFCFDPKELRAAFEQHPKAIIICNPSNPSGKVFTKDELSMIASMALEFDTFVIMDEVYEHIVFRPHVHTYFASLPGMFERTITCSSLSKTYSITGWRLGYTIASSAVTEAIKKVHDFLTVGAAAPLQEAAITALNFPDSYYKSLQKTYEEKRNFFVKALEVAEIPHTKPQGAYYLLADISKFKAKSDRVFCEWLARDIGIAAVPGSSFFREPVNNLIRFHFAKKQETLEEAARRLLKLRSL